MPINKREKKQLQAALSAMHVINIGGVYYCIKEDVVNILNTFLEEEPKEEPKVLEE